ncbi:hypothetical protein NKH52_31100 [Mesorhizobium sp. M1066]|uniref:Uncharacterized protein n=1 Tax=Mesorhizobium opportunistum TaxID=593909 RepID=A0ABV1YBD5_9HYPH|nr:MULTISPECIES: hypothetical protein [Mesorhizobium]WJI38585.1 hypothetical protein NL534_33315 [Mesorhizobium opportunistum]
MADIKKRYAAVTKQAQRKVAAAEKSSSPHPEEDRIYATFKKRAREDYRTMGSSKSVPLAKSAAKAY